MKKKAVHKGGSLDPIRSAVKNLVFCFYTTGSVMQMGSLYRRRGGGSGGVVLTGGRGLVPGEEARRSRSACVGGRKDLRPGGLPSGGSQRPPSSLVRGLGGVEKRAATEGWSRS